MKSTIVKRASLLLVLFMGTVMLCMAQTSGKMGRIAILSFTGGTEDEREAIPELLSYEDDITGNFTIIPRTTITNAISQEQAFQGSGMTDSDTIARLGNQFGADYVLAGNITKIGSANLLIVSVIRIDIIQQVAGDYFIYNSMNQLNEDTSIITNLAKNIIELMQDTSSNAEQLAVLPVEFGRGESREEGDALAQLLSIFLIRNGRYAVFPRTKSLDQVQQEYKTQLSGNTRDSEAVTLGRGINPPLALSIVSRKLGQGTRFNAGVIALETNEQVDGDTQQYASLEDGIGAIQLIALELSGADAENAESVRRRAESDRRRAESERQRAEAERQRAETARAVSAAVDNFLKKSGITFAGWLGMGFYTTPKDPTTTTSSSYSSSSSSDSSSSTTDIHALWYGGARAGVRLSPYFAVETGVGAAQKVHDDKTVTAMQIPLLLRANIWLGDPAAIGVSFLSPYVGIGLNMAYKDDSFSPTSLVFGIDLGFTMWKNGGLFTGYQYNHDFADSDYMIRTHVWVLGGFTHLVPFRK